MDHCFDQIKVRVALKKTDSSLLVVVKTLSLKLKILTVRF